MAKNNKKQEEKAEVPQNVDTPIPKELPKEAQEKLKEIKGKLEKFKKKTVDKFGKYIAGIALLPPMKEEEQKEVEKGKINVLVLIDDTDSQKMSKEELKDKLGKIIETFATEIDKNLAPQTIIFSELWQACYDAKHELLQLIAMSAPVYDKGMLAAIKIAEVHKEMVIKKFEKYIVSYVLAGSLVQGRATPESDIDVFCVVDDTDVKKMTRAELKDKLRAIIIGMGIEAGELTGVKNKLNVQVYILTDFWDSIKEANPIIFTFLRDGVPLYDRGIFMPWKQLLKMGKVKPSMEAIDMYMSSGEQMLERISFKIREIGMEDVFYAIVTPSQAALMLYGVSPPTPKETPKVIREVFVQKEKLLEEKFIKILERVINLRKELEHGTKKEVSGKEVDEIVKDGHAYLKRIKRLFTQIEKMKERENVIHTYDTVVTIIRDSLRLEGIEKVRDTEMVDIFEQEVVIKGAIPEKYLRMLKEIVKAKKDYDAKKLSKTDIENVQKIGREFIKFMVEYMQRKRGRELERVKIRVKHGKKYGEVLLLDKTAFIIHDIDQEEKEVTKAPIKANGGLGTVTKSNLEELEHALAKVEIPSKSFIKEPIFENLKNIFGKDVEILVNY